MEILKKRIAMMMLVVMALQLTVHRITNAMPVTDQVVINEVAWSGTADSSSDEWIELYNAGAEAVDLSGWKIVDDGTTEYVIESGEIDAFGYFVIGDSEGIFENLEVNVVVPISLANSGDSLVLQNADGDAVDTVNSGGDAWYAGNSGDKSTMERIDPAADGDNEENWSDAESGNGIKDAGGNDVLGTPGSVNSAFNGAGVAVSLELDAPSPQTGEQVTVSANIEQGEDLYAYGFEMNYDADVLRFVSAEASGALGSDGTGTSFHAALEDGAEGRLIVGNARLLNPPSGIDVDGEIFEVNFEVIGENGQDSDLSFGGTSFLADSQNDLPVNLVGARIVVGGEQTAGPQNVTVDAGSEQYALQVDWDAPEDGADSYLVKRLSALGAYETVFEGEETEFIDSNNLVPGVTYRYQVIALKDGASSAPTEVSGVETRGVTGDNDRSGRVDGRDLMALARVFGSEMGDQEFEVLVDTTYDGRIDGSDLIDIGANFGVKE